MKAIWDEILKVAVANKKSVGQFWSNGNEATAAYLVNGCTIGQNWDETAAALIKEGRNIGYLAPVEGAFAWMEGYCVMKKAKNVAQAYAWINWFLQPENGALFASSRASNSVAKGAEAHLPDAARNSLPKPILKMHSTSCGGGRCRKLGMSRCATSTKIVI